MGLRVLLTISLKLVFLMEWPAWMVKAQRPFQCEARIQVVSRLILTLSP